MEELGLRFGADTNAYTSYDFTVYHLEVALSHPSLTSLVPTTTTLIVRR